MHSQLGDDYGRPLNTPKDSNNNTIKIIKTTIKPMRYLILQQMKVKVIREIITIMSKVLK